MMNLYALVLVACLAGDPARCEDVQAGEHVMQPGCAMAGPTQAALYERLHAGEGRTVRRWRCERRNGRPGEMGGL